MVAVPSPAVAIVGRHNSGKTTLITQLIAGLVARGYDVGSVKHHSHVGFDIDIPGKDSYRHREAGASETVIAAPGQVARVKTIEGETECSDIVNSMPGHDIILVEGYRKSGLPTIELMRSGNAADTKTAAAFVEGARAGVSLGEDFTQRGRRKSFQHISDAEAPDSQAEAQQSRDSQTEAHQPSDNHDISNKMPTSNTVAVITDIPDALEAARIYGIPAFDLKDIDGILDFLQEQYVRPRLTVVIQAGGESKRMGRNKAIVPFAGQPLICHIVERLMPIADELIITTNTPDDLQFLYKRYTQCAIRLVTDDFDFRGALPGLHTALRSARYPYVAVVACDMVFASAALVVAEARVMSETGVDIVVPVNKHGFEPFHAVYRKSTCLPVVRQTIDEGALRAQEFFDKVNVYPFPQSKVLEIEPMGSCFINVNTPQELNALEKAFLSE